MEPFDTLTAVAVPVAIANVDTDQIIPARFLWRKRADGWGQLLFHDLRFAEDGKTLDPLFILNNPAYSGARILVADRNFGCGSSREHAVWSLSDYGIRAVIAPSFGDIFANNAYQNGLLPIILPEAVVAELLQVLIASPGTSLTVDLERQVVALGASDYPFPIDPFRKDCLHAGTDQIGFTLGYAKDIDAFDHSSSASAPWI